MPGEYDYEFEAQEAAQDMQDALESLDESLQIEVIDVKSLNIENVEKVDPILVFTGGGLEVIKKDLQKRFDEHVTDLSTDEARKAEASHAFAFRKAKVLLVKIGNTMIEDEKKKVKAVQAELRTVKDFCDDLAVKAREELTQWELDEAKKVEDEKKRLAAIAKQEADDKAYDEGYELAIQLNELHDLKAAAAKRADEAAAEKAKAEAEAQVAKLKAEAEAKAKKEADDKAAKLVKDAEAKAAKAKEDAEAVKVQAAKDKADAEAKVKEAEAKAKSDAAAAKVKADKDKADAVLKAQQKERDNAAEAIRTKAEKEKADKAEAEKKAANIKHKNHVNARVVKAFIDCGFLNGAQILDAIIAEKIPDVSIKY